MKLPQIKFTIRLTICAAVLLLSNRFCFADTCPSDVEATPTPPNEEILDPAYQPPSPDAPTTLRRFRFVPPGAGPNNQFPTVLMFPPDVFHLEYGDHGVPSERWATHDLQWAGFLVFQVNHRLVLQTI
jgi:hypothetical protein